MMTDSQQAGVVAGCGVVTEGAGALASQRLIDRIERDFTYHPPQGDQAERYGRIRSLCKDLALALVVMTPASREQSLALTNLEEVVFWANASIARNA